MPETDNSNQPATSSSSKPPRFRAACNQCHEAKVRCSGEKTGCSRCRDNDMRCEYAISMVGKTSSRDKRAKTNTGSRPTGTVESATTPRHSPNNGQAFLQNHGTPNASFPLTDNFYDPMDGLTRQNSIEDDIFGFTSYPTLLTPANSNEMNGLDSTLPDFDLDLPNVDFDLDPYPTPGLDDPESKSMHSTIPPTVGTVPAAYARGPSADINSTFSNRQSQTSFNNQVPIKAQYAHVIALVEIIGSLEAQIQANGFELDEVLRLNKMSVASVANIVAQQEKKLCKSSRALVPTAMELIVSLYEKTLSKDKRDGERMTAERADAARHRNSRLHFGVFPIDPKDQVAFENQLLIKEIHRSIHIIRLLAADCREAASGNSNCGSVIWYTKMEQRAKKLIGSLNS